MREIIVNMYRYKDKKDSSILIKQEETEDRRYIEKGAGWVYKTKGGKSYISLAFTVDGYDYKYSAFKNDYKKKGDKKPYFLILDSDKGKKGKDKNAGALWDKDFFYQGNIKINGYEYSIIVAQTTKFSAKAPDYKVYIETTTEEVEEYNGGRQTEPDENIDDSDVPF